MASLGGPNIVTSGLVLSLDAANVKSYPGSGTTWRDLSGNNNTGTLTNGPTFSSANGGSIVFDGVDDYVSLGTFNGLGSSNRTVDVWFRVNGLSPSGGRRVLTFPTDDSNTDTPAFTLGFNTTTSSLNLGFGGPPYNGYIGLNVFSLSTWIYVAGSVTGNTLTAYQNGVFVNTATNTGLVGANPLGYIARYNANYGQYGNVQVSNMRLYNRALSASEILQNYNATQARFNL